MHVVLGKFLTNTVYTGAWTLIVNLMLSMLRENSAAVRRAPTC